MSEMFVKLTRDTDGMPVYVNASQVKGVAGEVERTHVYVSEIAYIVKESVETVVTLLEAAMNGGFTR